MKKLFTKLFLFTTLSLFAIGNVSGQTAYKTIDADTIVYTTEANLNVLDWVTTGKGESTGFTPKTNQDVSDMNPETDIAYGSTTKLDCVNIKQIDTRSAWFYIQGVETIKAYYKIGADRTFTIDVYNEENTTAVKTATSTDTGNKGNFIQVSGLDASKKYILKTSATNDIFLYAVKFLVPLSGAPVITSFKIDDLSADIDQNAATITAELAYGVDITTIIPTVIVPEGYEYTPTGAQNFENSPITYTVFETANPENKKDYAVTITASTVEPCSELTVVSNYMINISNYDNASYTSPTLLDDCKLKVNAALETKIEIDASNKSKDGYNFTKRLKLGGTGSTASRNISIKIGEASKITVYGMSSTKGSERTLKVTSNDTDGFTLTNDGNAIGTANGVFDVANETEIFFYSEASGFNIYGIKVEPYSEDGQSVKGIQANDIRFDGRVIYNLNKEKVDVYSVSGHLIASSYGDIDLSSQSKGIYIVKSSAGIIKIALTK